MIKLKSTDSIQIVLAAGITANQCDFNVSYSDTAVDESSCTPSSSDGVTNSATAVTMVASPATGFVRHLSYVSVFNNDTASVTVTISKYNGSSLRKYIKATLAPNDRIEYTVDGGFKVVPAGVASALVNVQNVASAATITPTFANDIVRATAQSSSLTIANPSGTPVDGWGFVFELKDNGTARGLTFGSKYRGIGGSLPLITVASKRMIFGAIYNAADDMLDVILPVAQET